MGERATADDLDKPRADDQDDDDDLKQHDRVHQEHAQRLTLAATARATIVASRLMHLSQRRSGNGERFSAQSQTPSQVFHDGDFMDRVKSDPSAAAAAAGALHAGHVGVQLPDQIPTNIKGPVEVSIDQIDTALATLIDRTVSEPSNGSESDRKGVFLMAARAVLGLCPIGSADKMEGDCVRLVKEALVPDQSIDDLVAILDQPEHVYRLMKDDQRIRRSNINRSKTEFLQFDAFSSWKKSEKDAIRSLLKESDAFMKNQEKFVADKRKAIANAMGDRRNTAEGNKADDDQCCSCCLPSSGAATSRAAPADGERRRSSVARSQEQRSVSTSEVVVMEGGHPERPVSFAVGLNWITIALVRYANRNNPEVVVKVGDDVIQKQAMNMAWLDDNSLFVIDCWCRRYGIRESHRALVLLELLSRYPQISAAYFWDAIDLYEPLDLAQTANSLKLIERSTLHRLSSLSSSWCRACLSSYHDHFNGDTAVKGLGECVRLAILCRKLNGTADDLANETAPRYIDRICEAALARRYEYVVEAGRKMKDDQVRRQLNGSGDHDHRQQGRGVVTADPQRDTIIGDCRIVSSLHLIYVMQLLKKEIDDDIHNFGPILQSSAGFNAAQETSSLYFPLIWTDFQLFLRVQKSLIDLDRETVGNAPESLDPYIFQLYSELRSLYEFFAPHVDLPDINVGEHFAPFVDRWLEIQKEQFSSSRIEGAIRSDKWMAIGDTMCTTSVIDVFALLYPLADAFQHAPYSAAQSIKFADLLASSVSYYVRRLGEMIAHDIHQSHGRFTEVMALRLNDIQICKVKLGDMLKDINLERAYGRPPKLTESEVDDDDEFERFMDGGISNEVMDELGCKSTFKYIQETVESSAYEIATSMSTLWGALVTDLILHRPLDLAMDIDTVEQFLGPLWEELSATIESMIKSVFQTQELFRSLLHCVVIALEYHLIPQSTKLTMNICQVHRAKTAIELISELFKYYGLETAAIEGVKAVVRVRYMIELELGDTAAIAAIWATCPDEKAKVSEEERVRSPPYLTRPHLRRILLLRKSLGDPTATAFLKANKKPGWF